ncbi:heat stress transcription factor C-1b-like [Salvia splendens]|uniref:heat stress transcription factor C-1b-like n=1 Tax=Salvia splendens TaxID=180675 RepID=UPI00110414D9|nr:heat stress transcription factor C-1b-like [Salvia splendens]
MHEMQIDGDMIAPFVIKTYQILSDPTANRIIAWGGANNSFIVLEPLDFSQRILPLYFKHNNFSSFVRQLNTYGFRKVDPDRWEFANEWFLRGQTQLLSKIVRKKHVNRGHTPFVIKHEEEEECDGDDDDDNGGGGPGGDELVMEIGKLRREQESLDEELASMSRRLQATERRPKQMMTFLSKVVEDPQILPEMMLNRGNVRNLTHDSSSKKGRIMECSSSSCSSGVALPSSSAKSEEDLEGKSEDDRFGVSVIRQEYRGYGNLSSSSTDGSSGGVGGRGGGGGGGGGGGVPAPPRNGGGGCDGGDGVSWSYFDDLEMDRQKPAPYPFSLLDGRF